VRRRSVVCGGVARTATASSSTPSRQHGS
jgi:hypothetical protein